MSKLNRETSDLDRSEENIDRLCNMVTYQKIMVVILVVQLMAMVFIRFYASHRNEMGFEFLDNSFVLVFPLIAYVLIAVCYIVVTVKLSRMLNKISLTILLGYLSVIPIVNVLPFIVLFIQINRELNKYGIKTDHFMVSQHKIRSHFET